ncbi:hypothetical protein OA92_15190 [Marinomonas sp. SBI22]|uniref:type VI secretion system baseplate subunit TssG n=1 Tax=unclassified Marinomonas TaxID=196814 RepID=UPI0005F9F903|nr:MULTISPECIES: type VI secretion system baseplate subunit TssG [unclassified Marinomonas]KJZ14718.1 hypothetical protein TW85_08310 [Marinomonas sp. S3726]KZM40927.1 hypothetical protein OA92_15190 [Marinomonas sp. SBI22]KZM42767.1 hypothetical protein OA91_13395 [Marinomonas sp. SBI8L]
MSLVTSVLANPRRYDFIQVIRLLRMAAKEKQLRFIPEPMPEGDSEEVIAIELGVTRCKVTLGITALSGCRGVIPDYLYQELLNALHQEEFSLQTFLDVFNHRYYQLFADSVTSNLLLKEEQEVMQSSNSNSLKQKDALAQLSALPQSLTEGSTTSLLRFSVLIGLKTRNLKTLKQLLSAYFDLDISAKVAEKTIYRVPSDCLTKLGQQQGQNQQLGRGFLLGKQASQYFQSLEILVKPRSHREFLGLHANWHFARSLRALVSVYLRELTDVKVYLYVKRAYINEPKLSALNGGVRLGEANCLLPKHAPDEYRKILLQPER